LTTPTGGGPTGPVDAAPIRSRSRTEPTAAPTADPSGNAAAGIGGSPAAPRPATPKPPVTIASITHISGPAASGTLPGLDGLQLWVKHINERGGVNGHPVKLLVADDKSDSARHRQLVQEMVEQKGAIAFVQNGEALTGHGSVQYLIDKGVPVVNSIGSNDYFYTSPVHFPLVAHGEEFVRGALYNSGDYAKTKGVRKFGVIACTEAQICNDVDRIAGNAASARSAGLELVYKARTSLAQPDFTAECISARNAGVEILLVSLDGNSVARVAASCARQNYKPLISVFGAIAFDKMKDNPDLDGLTVNANGFPYFICGDPATTDFCDAQRKYGPVQVYGIGNSIGWTAGKAFELAARNLPDNPTPADVLAGLWTFKNETLGGLTHPLTFTKGQNAPRMTCWWPLVIEHAAFTAPDGMNVHCKN
jgi:branched-chain amino acid transport system substrate-binding protein